MTVNTRKASESESHMTWIVQPQDLNMHDTLFGGQLLAMMDRVAAMASMRHAHKNCVTVSIDKVDFVSPVRKGHLLDLTGRVHFTARTSMEIYVDAWAEDPLTGDRHQVCDAYFSFVAINRDGRPTGIPQVELETDRDHELNAAAKVRYDERRNSKVSD
ncbi:acyl-CoA thioesterase [Planctomycetota bacterium]|nr:acyl-CoA thioesterase [Planctomycetota bacterium]